MYGASKKSLNYLSNFGGANFSFANLPLLMFKVRVATFIIVQTPKATGLDEKIVAKFDKASYHLPAGEWLIAYEGTSKQLSDDLGINTDQTGNAIVFSVTSYWGRTNPQVWEWLKQYST